jgi:hypothetical protein
MFYALFDTAQCERHVNGMGILPDRQSANHPFVNSVWYADASITALVQFLGTRKNNHSAFILKEPRDCRTAEAG